MPEDQIDLARVDRDGAIREAAHAVAESPGIAEAAASGDTRAQILRKAALGSGGLVAGGIALGGLSGTALGADSRSSKQDVAILNFALTLEYLEAEFYRQAVAGNALSGDMRSFAQIVAGHEAAHVAFLQKALGSRAVASPAFDFQGIPTNPSRFLATAVSLEDTGVAAYAGQSYRIKRTAYILVAAQVLAIEARHAAWARSMVPSRLPAEKDEILNGHASMEQVLKVVASTGFIVK
jgi:rubrerythrin